MKPQRLSTEKWKGIGKIVFGLAIPVLFVTASFASPPQPGNQQSGQTHNGGRIAGDIDRHNPNAKVDVIVQFKVTPTATHYQKMAARGATLKTKLHSIKAAAFKVPVSALADMEKDSDILYVSPDRPLSLKNDNSYESVISAVEADLASQQYGLDGTGVGVAVIDSGVANHADFRNATGTRVIHSENFVPAATSAVDAYGHGTHVAGIIGGNGSASVAGTGYNQQITGIAPNVNIINLRVLDQNGAGTDSQVIAAIQRAIQLQSQYNIRVINLSLGRPVYESYTLDPLCQAVEQAWGAGIVVVVAAGNNGRDNSQHTRGFDTIGSPGNDPAVITVGATRTMGTATRVDDAIASYSSKGPTLLDHIVKPDVVAPGNRIGSLIVKNSTLDTEFPALEIAPTGVCATTSCPTQYFRLSGTSMATPVVSGAVALMLQNDPTLTPDTVKARIMKTAWKGFGVYCNSYDVFNNLYSNEYDLFTYGAGYLDIDAALANTDVANGVALSPTAIYNPGSRTVSIVNTSSVTWGSSVVWGTSVVWGNSIIWGNSVLTANSIVWGSSVVWGNTVDAGFSVVWGNSIIWGSSTATSAYSDGQDGEN